MNPAFPCGLLLVCLWSPQIAHAVPIVRVTRDNLTMENWLSSPGGSVGGAIYDPVAFYASYSGSSFGGSQSYPVDLSRSGLWQVTESGESGTTTYPSGYWYNSNCRGGFWGQDTFLGNAAAFLGEAGCVADSPSGVDWQGRSSVEMDWAFRITGDGASIRFYVDSWAGRPVGGFGVTLLDRTDGVTVVSYLSNRVGDYFEGSVDLLDGHAYELDAIGWASRNGGDPYGYFAFGFNDAELRVPDGGGSLQLLALSWAGLFAFQRLRARRT